LKFNLEIEKAAQTVPDCPLPKIAQPEVRSLALSGCRLVNRMEKNVEIYKLPFFSKDNKSAPYVCLENGSWNLVIPK
jgi:hypothetical protein